MSWAEKYLAIRYLDGGRDEKVGLDCWGLVRLVFAAEWGIEITSEAIAQNTGAWSEVEGCHEGDAVALGRTGEGISHVGIALDASTILHAVRGHGMVVASLRSLERSGFTDQRGYRHASRLTC